MSKTVSFSNTSGQAQYVTLRKLRTDDYMPPTPPVFDNGYDGHALLALTDVVGMMFPNGDVSKKPFFYIRHTDILKEQYRFGNLVELGDTFLEPQKGVLHAHEVAQAGVSVTPYRELEGKPGVFGYESMEPAASFSFSEQGFTASEGDFFSIIGEPWGHAIFEHRSLYNNVSTVIQPASILGQLDGRPILGLGEHDRSHIPSAVGGFDGITGTFGYFYINMMGIRHDGRHEQALISIDNSGKIFARYFIDGEQPIMSDEVKMTADWVRLPYVEDGTCIYEDATFEFAGKTIHFHGKWGSKGFTPEPRIEKHGQSQVFGTWYEGDTPYDHKLFMGFAENMEAYDHKLEAMGFDVIG